MFNFANKLLNTVLGNEDQAGQQQQQQQQQGGGFGGMMGGGQQQRPGMMGQAAGGRPGFTGPRPGAAPPGMAGPRGMGGPNRQQGPMGGMQRPGFRGPGPMGAMPGAQQQAGGMGSQPGMGGPGQQMRFPPGGPNRPMGPGGRGPGPGSPGMGPPRGPFRGPRPPPGTGPPGQMRPGMRPPPGMMRPGFSPSGHPQSPRGPGGMQMNQQPSSMQSPQQAYQQQQNQMQMHQMHQQQQQQQPNIGMLSSSPQQGLLGSPSSNLLMAGRGASPLPQGDIDLDLSHLTPLERAKIQSVMVKANQDATSPVPPPFASSQQGLPGRSPIHGRMNGNDPFSDLHMQSSEPPMLCGNCQQRDVSGRVDPPGQPCSECKSIICQVCSTAAPSLMDGRVMEPLCPKCLPMRRNQLQQRQHQEAQQQQQAAQQLFMNTNDYDLQQQQQYGLAQNNPQASTDYQTGNLMIDVLGNQQQAMVTATQEPPPRFARLLPKIAVSTVAQVKQQQQDFRPRFGLQHQQRSPIYPATSSTSPAASTSSLSSLSSFQTRQQMQEQDYLAQQQAPMRQQASEFLQDFTQKTSISGGLLFGRTPSTTSSSFGMQQPSSTAGQSQGENKFLGSLLGNLSKFSTAVTTTTTTIASKPSTYTTDSQNYFASSVAPTSTVGSANYAPLSRQPAVKNGGSNNRGFELPNPFGPMYDISLAERLGATSPEIDELIRQELSKTGASLDDDDILGRSDEDMVGPSDVQSLMAFASPPETAMQNNRSPATNVPATTSSNAFLGMVESFFSAPTTSTSQQAEPPRSTAQTLPRSERKLKRYIDETVFELPPSMQNIQPILVQPAKPTLDEILGKDAPTVFISEATSNSSEPPDVDTEFKKKFPNLASMTVGSLFSKSLEDDLLNPDLTESLKNIQKVLPSSDNVPDDEQVLRSTQKRDYSYIFGPSWRSSESGVRGMNGEPQKSALEEAVKIGRQINQFISESSTQGPFRTLVDSTNPFLTSTTVSANRAGNLATTKQIRDPFEDQEYYSSKTPSPPPPVLNLTSEYRGEVYTIPEEEEESGSPTAPDGVSSLNRRKRDVPPKLPPRSRVPPSAPRKKTLLYKPQERSKPSFIINPDPFETPSLLSTLILAPASAPSGTGLANSRKSFRSTGSSTAGLLEASSSSAAFPSSVPQVPSSRTGEMIFGEQPTIVAKKSVSVGTTTPTGVETTEQHQQQLQPHISQQSVHTMTRPNHFSLGGGLQRLKIYDNSTSSSFNALPSVRSTSSSTLMPGGLPNVVTGMSPPSRPLSREELYGPMDFGSTIPPASHVMNQTKPTSIYGSTLSPTSVSTVKQDIKRGIRGRGDYDYFEDDSENDDLAAIARSIFPQERPAPLSPEEMTGVREILTTTGTSKPLERPPIRNAAPQPTLAELTSTGTAGVRRPLSSNTVTSSAAPLLTKTTTTNADRSKAPQGKQSSQVAASNLQTGSSGNPFLDDLSAVDTAANQQQVQQQQLQQQHQQQDLQQPQLQGQNLQQQQNSFQGMNQQQLGPMNQTLSSHVSDASGNAQNQQQSQMSSGQTTSVSGALDLASAGRYPSGSMSQQQQGPGPDQGFLATSTQLDYANNRMNSGPGSMPNSQFPSNSQQQQSATQNGVFQNNQQQNSGLGFQNNGTNQQQNNMNQNQMPQTPNPFLSKQQPQMNSSMSNSMMNPSMQNQQNFQPGQQNNLSQQQQSQPMTMNQTQQQFPSQQQATQPMQQQNVQQQMPQDNYQNQPGGSMNNRMDSNVQNQVMQNSQMQLNGSGFSNNQQQQQQGYQQQTNTMNQQQQQPQQFGNLQDTNQQFTGQSGQQQFGNQQLPSNQQQMQMNQDPFNEQNQQMGQGNYGSGKSFQQNTQFGYNQQQGGLMSQQNQQLPVSSAASTTSTSGSTISGMLADFSKALGLGTKDEKNNQQQMQQNMNPQGNGQQQQNRYGTGFQQQNQQQMQQDYNLQQNQYGYQSQQQPGYGANQPQPGTPLIQQNQQTGAWSQQQQPLQPGVQNQLNRAGMQQYQQQQGHVAVNPLQQQQSVLYAGQQPQALVAGQQYTTGTNLQSLPQLANASLVQQYQQPGTMLTGQPGLTNSATGGTLAQLLQGQTGLLGQPGTLTTSQINLPTQLMGTGTVGVPMSQVGLQPGTTNVVVFTNPQQQQQNAALAQLRARNQQLQQQQQLLVAQQGQGGLVTLQNAGQAGQRRLITNQGVFLQQAGAGPVNLQGATPIEFPGEDLMDGLIFSSPTLRHEASNSASNVPLMANSAIGGQAGTVIQVGQGVPRHRLMTVVNPVSGAPMIVSAATGQYPTASHSRQRWASNGRQSSWDSSFVPLTSNAVTSGMGQDLTGTNVIGTLTLGRPSSSETNIHRMLQMTKPHRELPMTRPGSALAMLQGSTVASSGLSMRTTASSSLRYDLPSTTTTAPIKTDSFFGTSSNSGSSMSDSLRASLVSVLPPDLHHLIDKTKPSGSGSSNRSSAANVAYHTQNLKAQLKDELRLASTDRWKSFDSLAHLKQELRQDPLRRLGLSSPKSRTLGRSRGHRRQMSDPRIHMSALEQEEYDKSYRAALHGTPRLPLHKSFEFEDYERNLHQGTSRGSRLASLPPRAHSSLGDYQDAHSSNYYDQPTGVWPRRSAGSSLLTGRRSLLGRRGSEGALGTTDHLLSHHLGVSGVGTSLTGLRAGTDWGSTSEGEILGGLSPVRRSILARRGHLPSHLLSHRRSGSRSWHPSPYGSDEEEEDEEDAYSREEKKSRIKAEIARRRRQIVENRGLQTELVRLARLRNQSDLSAPYGHSVLRSIDDILREDEENTALSGVHHAGVSSYLGTAAGVGAGGYGTSGYSSLLPSSAVTGAALHRLSQTSPPSPGLMAGRLGGVGSHYYNSSTMGALGTGLGAGLAGVGVSGAGGVGSHTYLSEEDRSMERLASTFQDDYGGLGRSSPLMRRLAGSSYRRSSSMTRVPGETSGSSLYLPHRLSSTGSSTGINPSNNMTSSKFDENYGVLGGRTRKLYGSTSMASYTNDASQIGYETAAQSQSRLKRVQASHVPEPPQCSSKQPKLSVKKILVAPDTKFKAPHKGLGIRVTGGKRIANVGMAAVISKILPGGQIAAIEEVHEGDVVLEWNGIPLTGKTHEEVQRIVNETPSGVELELSLRCTHEDTSGPDQKLGLHRRDDDGDADDDEEDDDGDDRDSSRSRAGSDELHRRRMLINAPPPANSSTLNPNVSHSSKNNQHLANHLASSSSLHRASMKENRMFPGNDGYLQSNHFQTNAVHPSGRHKNNQPPFGAINANGQVGRANTFQRIDTSRFKANGAVRSGLAVNQPNVTTRASPYSERTGSPTSTSDSGSDQMKSLLLKKGEKLALDASSRNRTPVDVTSTQSSSQRSHGTPSSKSTASNYSPRRRQRRFKPVTKREDNYGRIQLQICYDVKAEILYVGVLRAKSLTFPRTDGDNRPDPFVKCRLLPDKANDGQRKTRFYRRTGSPEWKQTMVYPKLPIFVLRMKRLECVVWHHNKIRPNDYLGEVLLDLSDPKIIDEQPRWYRLRNGALPIPANKIVFGTGGDKKRFIISNNCYPNSFHGYDKRLFGSNVSLSQRIGQQTGISLVQQNKRGNRVPLFPASNISAHPLLSKYGCHGAASMCVLM